MYNCCPLLALRLLKYIAENLTATQFPLASNKILTDFYVEDPMLGVYSCQVKKLLTAQQEIWQLFGLSIRKWCTNSLTVINNIPSELCEISEHFFEETDYQKTLVSLFRFICLLCWTIKFCKVEIY